MRTGSLLHRLWAVTAGALVVLGSVAAPASAAQEVQPGPAPVEQATDPAVDAGRPDDLEPAEPVQPDEPIDPGDDTDVEEPTTPPDDPLQPVDPTDPAPVDPAAGPVHRAEPVEGALVVVLPAIIPTVVGGVAGYVLPDLAGVTWLLDGAPVTELVAAGAARHLPDELGADRFEVTTTSLGRQLETVVLAAVAAEGHLLATEDGKPVTACYVVDPRAPVELVAPSAADDDGRGEDAVVVPDVPGQVARDAAGTVLEPGTHPVTAEYVDGTATVQLTVEAAPDHRLEAGGAPVETVPGAGGLWPATLTFTDLTPPVDDPTGPEPAPTVDADTGTQPISAAEPGTDLVPGPHVVTVGEAPEPELAASAPQAAPITEPEPAAAAVGQPRERLSDSGRRDVDLMVVLSLVFIGGAWLVVGVGRDMR